ncbi:MAG TPA: site-specific integrase [Gemmataceae bacterium]
MRRPHPRFDEARDAWVTRAGGTLKVLAKGPKNAETESTAWDAFYVHMAKLGNPIEGSALPVITLGDLADKYGDWMKREVEAGRMKPRTLDYYRDHIQKFLDAVGGRRPALGVVPHEVEMFKTNWHSVQAVQRLYNWGVEMGLLRENPVRSVKKPDLGQRERVLTAEEENKLLDGTDKHFGPFLVALLHTIARPQEVRVLQWKHLVLEPVPMFVLTDFKAKQRRKDRKSAIRRILLDETMIELLDQLAKKRRPCSDDFVFLDRQGRPWTSNAIRCRMRRLRAKLKLGPDSNGENVVAYTFRHTAATRACTSGVPDRVLADLMGHTNVTTTHRYQHPQLDHLAEAIRRANARKAQ